MKALSASSNSADPYRAGLELGTALKHAVLKWCYCLPRFTLRKKKLIEGIYDALDNDNLILIGNTGDGYYYESKGREMLASPR